MQAILQGWHVIVDVNCKIYSVFGKSKKETIIIIKIQLKKKKNKKEQLKVEIKTLLSLYASAKADIALYIYTI